jgi:hypothetical protein
MILEKSIPHLYRRSNIWLCKDRNNNATYGGSTPFEAYGQWQKYHCLYCKKWLSDVILVVNLGKFCSRQCYQYHLEDEHVG